MSFNPADLLDYSIGVDLEVQNKVDAVQRQLDMRKGEIQKIADADKVRAQFLVEMIRGGYEDIAAVLEPEFLGVENTRQSIAAAVRALEILDAEALHESDSWSATCFGEEPQRTNYARDSYPRKIMTHLDWATEHLFLRGPNFSRLGGDFFGGVTQSTPSFTPEIRVYPTVQGVVMVDEYRNFAGLPSREEMKLARLRSDTVPMFDVSKMKHPRVDSLRLADLDS